MKRGDIVAYALYSNILYGTVIRIQGNEITIRPNKRGNNIVKRKISNVIPKKVLTSLNISCIMGTQKGEK